ncbi:MAG: calcium-binding protein [Paracoccaceae bacterium]
MPTIVQTDSFIGENTNGDIFSGSFSFDQFEAGPDARLTSASVLLTMTFSTTGQIFGDPTPGPQSGSATSTYSLEVGGDSSPLGLTVSGNINAASGPVSLTSLGPTPVFYAGEFLGTDVPLANVNPFVGGGEVEIPYEAFSGTLASGGLTVGPQGPLFTNENTAILSLTYTFEVVNQTLNGTAGNDRLDGGRGNDTINGADGSDTILGGDGDDVLIGGASTVDLRDAIFGGVGNDRIDGGYGNDELRGEAGNDTMEGGFGVDTLIGGDGDDVLTGSAFSDLVFGNDGDDFINGGFGSDRVNGGDGGDRFFHIGTLGHGSDWIQDYDSSEGDILRFGGAGAAANFQVNIANTAGAGDASVAEAFVIYRPTGQILWALVDGAGQDEINLGIGGDVIDLLA